MSWGEFLSALGGILGGLAFGALMVAAGLWVSKWWQP